jgi:hypothetical protein
LRWDFGGSVNFAIDKRLLGFSGADSPSGDVWLIYGNGNGTWLRQSKASPRVDDPTIYEASTSHLTPFSFSITLPKIDSLLAKSTSVTISGGALAGVLIAIIVCVIVCFIGVVYIVTRRRKNKKVRR